MPVVSVLRYASASSGSGRDPDHVVNIRRAIDLLCSETGNRGPKKLKIYVDDLARRELGSVACKGEHMTDRRNFLKATSGALAISLCGAETQESSGRSGKQYFYDF